MCDLAAAWIEPRDQHEETDGRDTWKHPDPRPVGMIVILVMAVGIYVNARN